MPVLEVVFTDGLLGDWVGSEAEHKERSSSSLEYFEAGQATGPR